MGNQIFSLAIVLALGFPDKGLKGGVPSCSLVIGLALSVLAVLSRDEAHDITAGDIPSVI